MLPTLATLPASRARPTEVHIASKKTDSRIAKTKSDAAIAPIEENAAKENSPSRLRSGALQPGRDGATRLQPSGLTLPASSTEGPMLKRASTMLAKIVETTMPMRMAPGTLRTTRMAVNNNPTTKTRTGQPASSPSMPSPSGTVVPAASGTRRTNPEFTSPMRVMNKPMPTTMPVLIASGTARKTAVRNPVRTKTTMTSPAMTTSPMASGQVRSGVVAIVMAISELTPRPAAKPNGWLAHMPISTVMTAAIRAVEAATAEMPSSPPEPSAPDNTSGLSTMM